MIRMLLTTIAMACFCSLSQAAIFTELPPTGKERVPTSRVEYDTIPVEGGSVIDLDISGTFSFNVLGSIPPNETLIVDVGTSLGNAGQPYRVIGLGWDVLLDAFIPSWLSDSAFAFGDDPSFTDPPDLLVAPGMGDDFPFFGLMRYDTGGIIDLTNVPGQGDVSFELSSGVLYLEFFEIYDDFGDGPAPDAIWEQGSHLMIQVVAVPEPVIAGWICFVGLLWCRNGARGSESRRDGRV